MAELPGRDRAQYAGETRAGCLGPVGGVEAPTSSEDPNVNVHQPIRNGSQSLELPLTVGASPEVGGWRLDLPSPALTTSVSAAEYVTSPAAPPHAPTRSSRCDRRACGPVR